MTEAPQGVQLTEQQKKNQRSRSLAIAWILGSLVVLLFLVTIVKLGPAVLNRPL
jgi:hypothetical protein